MRAGRVDAGVLSFPDVRKVTIRLERAMRGAYPAGARDPALWKVLVPELEEGGVFQRSGLSPAGADVMAARLLALPPGNLSCLLAAWLPVLQSLLPEEYYPVQPKNPTAFAPGSRKKLWMLRERASRGLALFRCGDAQVVDEELCKADPEAAPAPAKNFKRAGGGGGVSDARHRKDREADAGARAKKVLGGRA